MSNKKETIFPDGFILKRNANAPEWVVGNLSIKVEEAIKFLTDHQKKGWVNIEMKISKEGKPYCELDTWEPTKQSDAPNKTVAESKAQGLESPAQEEALPF